MLYPTTRFRNFWWRSKKEFQGNLEERNDDWDIDTYMHAHFFIDDKFNLLQPRTSPVQKNPQEPIAAAINYKYDSLN